MSYSGTQDSGTLSRSVTVGMLDVTGGSIIPGLASPSRIANLRVQVNAISQHVTFFWTAPGDQRDHGRRKILFTNS